VLLPVLVRAKPIGSVILSSKCRAALPRYGVGGDHGACPALRLGSFHRPVDPRRLPPIRPAILANIFLWSQLFALLPPHSDGVFHIKITNAARAFDSPACGTHAHTLPHNQTDRKHCRRSEPSAMLLPGTVTVSGKRSRSGLIVQWPKRRSRPSGRHAAVRKVISSNRTSVAVSIFKLPRQPTGILVA
jgi:hypothetical protein